MRKVMSGLAAFAGLAAVCTGIATLPGAGLAQSTISAGHLQAFGDTQLLSACFSAEALAPQSSEVKPVKGDRTFDRVKSTGDLSPFAPIPVGLQGAVRRVNVRDGAKLIALTLDLCEQTGEVAGYDGAIFDYLRANRIKATLFTGGKWMRSHELRTRQLVADPLFEMANHAEAHRNLRLLSPRVLKNEIEAPQRAYEGAREALAKDQCVASVAGALENVPQRMGLFRFPFGACNAGSMAAVNDAGLLAIQWDISTGDPDPRTSAAATAASVLGKVKPGSIIIAHANGRGHNTAVALSQFIPKLLAQGYQFVTVSELLAAGTPEIVPTCYDAHPGDTDRYDHLPFQQQPAKPADNNAGGTVDRIERN